MKPRETAALALASASIIISAVSAYFQFFHDSYDLRASVLSVSVNSTEVKMTVVLLNRGNRESVVSSAVPCLYKPTDRWIISESDKIGTNSAGLPTILRAGEVRLIEVCATVSPELVSQYAFQPTSKQDEPEDAKVLLLGIAFRAADDKGVRYDSQKHVIDWIISPSKTEGREVRPMIFSLFQRSIR